MSFSQRDLFREEALESHASGRQADGCVLRVHPRSTGWIYWTVLALVVAAVAFGLIARVHDYAGGPALIRVAGRTMITSVAEGTVASVLIEPGEKAEPGALLARLDDTSESAELDRINRELESQTRAILLDLGNRNARAALASLQASRRRAQAALAERQIRATHAGVVSDIRIRVGQHVIPGQPLVTLLKPDSSFSVLALLPGESRPQLKTGGDLRLEMTGYRYAYQFVSIESIGDQVIGPDEARRFLGSDVADAVLISGPVVLVRATLPGKSFRADGRTYSYHDGMVARAEARLRSENVFVASLPGLKALFGADDD